MMEVILVISNLCFASLSAYFWHKSKSKVQARKNSVELDEFLADLMTGGAIVEVKRLPPENVMIRHKRL